MGERAGSRYIFLYLPPRRKSRCSLAAERTAPASCGTRSPAVEQQAKPSSPRDLPVAGIRSLPDVRQQPSTKKTKHRHGIIITRHCTTSPPIKGGVRHDGYNSPPTPPQQDTQHRTDTHIVGDKRDVDETTGHGHHLPHDYTLQSGQKTALHHACIV